MTSFDSLVFDTVQSLPILAWAALGIFLLILQIIGMRTTVILGASLVGMVVLGGLSVFNPLGDFLVFSSKGLFSSTISIDQRFEALNFITILSFFGTMALLMIKSVDESRLMKVSYQQLPELLICLAFSGFGASVLIAASDLSTLFLGLETFSIGLYCACGFYRTEMRSTESAFKYLMIGAFSTVLFLFGVAFLYGATGVTQYNLITSSLSLIGNDLSIETGLLLQISCIFLMAAFAFKLSLVPFHYYAPDVYEGAPSPITFLLSTVVKVGALGAAIRLFSITLAGVSSFWKPYWVVICLVSIIIGNLSGLKQRSLKKLLTYSSISHSGFMALLLLLPEEQIWQPLFSYLIVYVLMNLGLFSLICLMENRAEVFMVEDLKGLVKRRPAMAFAFGLFILGLAGLPPFAGFLVKFWVLESLIKQGFLWTSILAIGGSIIGVAYYLRLLMLIFMSDEEGRASGWFAVPRQYIVQLLIFVGALITLFGGLKPQIYVDWILGSLALK